MAFRDGKRACALCGEDGGGGTAPNPEFVSWEADCLASDEVGHFVYVTGPSVGGFRQVTRVDVYDSTTMPAIGVITAKETATRCTVQVLGELTTPSLSPAIDRRYWVGADSKLADAPPAKIPDTIVVVQVAGTPLDSNVLMLRPDLNPVKLRG